MPMPRDVAATFRNLANAYSMMRADPAGSQERPRRRASNEADLIRSHDELLESMLGYLIENAEHPPPEVEGVSDEFIEQLERVPKKALKEDMSCPICANPFLEGTCNQMILLHSC
jgi:hypothetical protein